MSSDLRELERFLDYTVWANGRLLRCCVQVSRETWQEEVVSSYPSLMETWRHVIYWHAAWLSRCRRGLGMTEEAEAAAEWSRRAEQTQSPEDFEELNRVAGDGWQSFIKEAGDPERMIAYRNKTGKERQQPLREIVQQLAMHAAYHRGQITTLLRQLGGEPVATDLIRYDWQVQESANPE